MIYHVMGKIFVAFLCLFMTITPVWALVVDWKVHRPAPIHVGVAPELSKYEIAFKALAISRGINFTTPVTMGIDSLKSKKSKKAVVGLCTRDPKFREIDADTEYWNASTETTRRTLIYHEMTHCLCGRDHDWGVGVEYPEPPDDKNSILAEPALPPPIAMVGMMPDGCPMSIMYPYVVSDKCAEAHWPEYEREMFERCIPY